MEILFVAMYFALGIVIGFRALEFSVGAFLVLVFIWPLIVLREICDMVFK